MIIFLDTNVLLDVFMNSRPCHKDSSFIIDMAEKGDVDAVVSTQSIVDAAYVYLQKSKLPLTQFELSVWELLSRVKATSVSEENIKSALLSHMEDFEDSAQIDCALDAKCDAIISSDKKMKDNGRIAVFSPAEFLSEVFGE